MRSGRLVLIFLLVVSSLVGAVATLYVATAVRDRTDLGAPVIAAALSFVLVGVLIVVRRPGNRIGWMLLAAGVSLQVGVPVELYAIHAHTPGGPPPSGEAIWAGWVATWLWTVPIFVLFGGLPLVYPDGRLPSPRWRPVAWAVGAVAGLSALGLALRSGPMMIGDERLSENPLGVDVLEPYVRAIGRGLDIGGPLVMVMVAAAVVVRWRRSRGVERQQMKWFFAAVAATTSAILLQIVFSVPEAALWLVWLAVPAAIAIALLRYRLYEIDRIISRTVSYGLLTALLVGVYVAGVVGLGGVVRSVTGGGGGDLVVAASTLAVAALFGPARRRIQAVVDRRFNRARYDAQQTVEAFAQRLRGEVDLSTVRQALAATAGSAVQPRTVVVWLRDVEALR